MDFLKVGAQAPDFALESVDGQQLTLNGYLQENKHVLLVFLRHMG